MTSTFKHSCCLKLAKRVESPVFRLMGNEWNIRLVYAHDGYLDAYISPKRAQAEFKPLHLDYRIGFGYEKNLSLGEGNVKIIKADSIRFWSMDFGIFRSKLPRYCYKMSISIKFELDFHYPEESIFNLFSMFRFVTKSTNDGLSGDSASSTQNSTGLSGISNLDSVGPDPPKSHPSASTGLIGQRRIPRTLLVRSPRFGTTSTNDGLSGDSASSTQSSTGLSGISNSDSVGPDPPKSHPSAGTGLMGRRRTPRTGLLSSLKYTCCRNTSCGLHQVSSLCKDFSMMLESGLYHDVEIRCGMQVIKAHRNILSARSEVFKAMLESNMREGQTGIVDIQDIDINYIQDFLTYLYTDILPELTFDNAKMLYELGDKYAVRSLMDRCSKHLQDNVSQENACECLALADAHNDEKFKDRIAAYILETKIYLQDEIWSPFCEQYPKISLDIYKLFHKNT